MEQCPSNHPGSGTPRGSLPAEALRPTETLMNLVARDAPGAVTSTEAAFLLHTSRWTIYRAVKRGDLRTVTGLGVIRIPVAEIRRVLGISA